MPLDLSFMLSIFQPKSSQSIYHKALELYSQKQYQRALRLLQKLEQQKPDWAVLHYTKGLCYQGLDQLQEAKGAYQRALSIEPDDTDCLYNLARLYYDESNLDVALAYAELANDLVAPHGGDADISYLLGLIYEEQEQIPEAICAYENSLQQNPEQFLCGLYLSKLYIRLQDFDQAIDLLEKLTVLEPDNLEVHFELSLCFAKRNDWEKTIRACKRVIEIDPEYTKAYNQLGLAEYCTGNLDAAIEHYEKALQLQPGFSTAINNLAYALEKAGYYDRAIQKFKEYLPYTVDRPAERAEIEEHIEQLTMKAYE